MFLDVLQGAIESAWWRISVEVIRDSEIREVQTKGESKDIALDRKTVTKDYGNGQHAISLEWLTSPPPLPTLLFVHLPSRQEMQ